MPAHECLPLGSAEEEAVEDEVEHPPVLLRLGERGGERLPELALVGPADGFERPEGVEQLGRADRHPLAAKLVGQLEQARRESR